MLFTLASARLRGSPRTRNSVLSTYARLKFPCHVPLRGTPQDICTYAQNGFAQGLSRIFFLKAGRRSPPH